MKPSPCLWLCVAALVSACSSAPTEDIVRTWPNSGAPREIHTILADSSGTEVRILHENGRIHMRGVLRDGLRHGTWNTYREDGMPWSQVQYALGVKDGLFRTWHEGGAPHIEGQHAAGAPFGTWRFHDMNGQLLETETYPAPN